MNQKGGMENLISGLVWLFMFIVVLYITMVIWQPITVLLYPILNNAAAFPQGNVAVVLLQLFPLVIVAAAFIAFFMHVQGRGGQAPPQYGYA